MKDLPQIVYVVDDDDAVRDSLRLLLKSAALNCEVHSAAREFLQRRVTHTRMFIVISAIFEQRQGVGIVLPTEREFLHRR